MTDETKEILAMMRYEVAEIKLRPEAKFHPNYDPDGAMQEELEDEIAALKAEADAMMKLMGDP